MGTATLICILASDKISMEALLRVMDTVVLEIRKNRMNLHSISIIFYSYSIENIFRYRDVFTRYIDTGVRVYIENKHSQLIKILTPCTTTYIANEDDVAKELSEKISIVVKTV